MTTYLEQAVGLADQHNLLAGYVAALGTSFDDRIKETRVVDKADLDAFTNDFRRVVYGESPRRAEALLEEYVAHGRHVPAVERDARTESSSGIVHTVSCRPGEAVIVANNELLQHFYNFDLWRSVHDQAWLANEYATAIRDLRNAFALDGLLFVAKRLGPLGPLSFMERLSHELGQPAYVLNLRSHDVIGNSELLRGQRVCILYDLVHSGVGLQEIADLCRGFGATPRAAVVLYRYPNAPTPADIAIENVMNRSAENNVSAEKPLDLESAAAVLRQHFASVSREEFWKRASRASNGDIIPPN